MTSPTGGTWKKYKDKIILKITKGSGALRPGMKAYCSFFYRSHPFRYRSYIDCRSSKEAESWLRVFRYYAPNSSSKAQIPIKVGKYSLINMGLKVGKVTANVFVRSEPNIKSRPLKLEANPCSDDTDYLERYPRGRELHAIGRSVKKTRINKWNNYWYYVIVVEGGCGEGSTRRGWIFGKFINFNRNRRK